jgi:predicted esterase
MGFSQGACMSLCISLERSFSGGVFTTGGIFFPFLKEIKVKNSILAYCGDQDIKYPKNIFLDSFENFKNELPV